MRMAMAVATVGFLGSVGAVAAEPELVFSMSDVPALRERVKTGGHDVIWAEILARANDYCTPGSRRYGDPDGIDAPVEGARIQVLAHHFGRRLSEWVQALGFAHLITGEERFAVHGARILTAAANRLPASDPRIAKSFAGARGDIMRGFAMGLDWLGGALGPGERRLVEEIGGEYIRVILKEAGHEKTWWVPSHNFMGVSLGAAGCLSLKLRDRFPDESEAWIKACAGHVTRWLDEGFDDQGAYFEGTGYAHYGLTNAVLLAHALQRAGDPDLFEHAHLRRVPRFFAMSLLPGDRAFDARNALPGPVGRGVLLTRLQIRPHRLQRAIVSMGFHRISLRHDKLRVVKPDCPDPVLVDQIDLHALACRHEIGHVQLHPASVGAQ